jgi:integrase
MALGNGSVYKGRMNSKGSPSDTPTVKTALVAVPGHTRLFRRGAIYYFRAKVPHELRPVLDKTEIRYSLKTADLKKAKQACNVASVKADAELKRAALSLQALAPRAPTPLSEEQLFHLVASWFVKRERESEQWAAQERPRLDEDERAAVLDNLKGDAAAFGSEDEELASWGESLVAEVLSSSAGVTVLPGSDDYKRLAFLAKNALNEHLNRSIDQVAGRQDYKPPKGRFTDYYAHSVLQAPKSSATLKEVTDSFMKMQHETNANTTPVTYRIPIRILLEVLGEKKRASEVSTEDIWKVCESLERIPAFSGQRYKGQPLLSAIAKADREGKKERLSKHTVWKYFNNLHAIFNFAKEREWLEKVPTEGKRLKERFGQKPRSKPTAHFTDAELNAIFRAPLYTGCIDDEINFSNPGPNHPKRGRFWVPLLALFHGVRCNEACQLYCEDVKEEDGIHYLDIRTTLDDEEEAGDKNIKNDNSIRQVPLHPQIIKMGFLEFVEARRLDGPKARLFSEIKQGKSTKRYSTYFSRWFTRFKKHACGHQPRARFHSLRHQFRTALASAGVPLEYTDALCGWDDSERGMEKRYFQAHLKQLAAAVAKVHYEGLDLSHLDAAPSPHIEKKQRVRYRP